MNLIEQRRSGMERTTPVRPDASAQQNVPQWDGKRSQLHCLRSRCQACGVPFRGFQFDGQGVVQADRPAWRAACSRAAQVGSPIECADFRKALHLTTRMPA